MANQYVNKLVKDGVTKFDLTSDTVTAATLKSGYTAHNAAGQKVTGALLSQDTTATPGKILKGYTAYDNAGNLMTGTYKEPYVLGLRVDYVNQVFTRLEDAVNLRGGSDFDIFSMYKRRRCNLADDGTVNAYYGDENYTEDGSNGQVMVEQPKFYYKVVVTDPADATVGSAINVAEYYVSNVKLEGFKVHPAFLNADGTKENDYFYEGAFEAFNDTGDKLGSKAGVSLLLDQNIVGFRTRANNRGTGWEQSNVWAESADQLLMIIEYGAMNMQSALGIGNAYSSAKLTTGQTTGNGSSGDTSSGTTAVCWRGKENPWGNVFKWVDGINIVDRRPYIIVNSHNYDSSSSSNPYVDLGFNVPSSGFVSKFGYNPDFDWLFMQIEASGSSAGPVGDYVASSSGFRVVRLGGHWRDGYGAGPFCWILDSSNSAFNQAIGGRLLFMFQ